MSMGTATLTWLSLGSLSCTFVSADPLFVLFTNDGADENGNLILTESVIPLGEVFAGASDIAWGDFDGDGDPDLALGSEGVTVIYRNDDGALTPLPNELPGYAEDSSYDGSYDLRSLTWADFDNDSDLDLLVPSVFDFDTLTLSTRLLRNDGADGSGRWVFTDVPTNLAPTAHAQSAWADDDGDEDLDLLLANVDLNLGSGFLTRYENNAGTFTGEDLLSIIVHRGLADWGDYDADGDLDVLVAGNIEEADGTFGTVLRVYTNDGGVYSITSLTDTEVFFLARHPCRYVG